MSDRRFAMSGYWTLLLSFVPVAGAGLRLKFC
jgi:hypothetical protein